jgi:hypothetical protein
MIKEPLLRNLSFDELLIEIERDHSADPLYNALVSRWNENQEELQEEVTDLRNELQSVSDDRDDTEWTLDRKLGYLQWAGKFVPYIVKNGFWEFKRMEEKGEDSNFLFEKHYTFNYGGYEFENRKEIFNFNSGVIVSHGETTQIEVSMNTIYHKEILNYEKPVTEEQALSDAKALLVKFIFDRVEYE